MERPISPLAPVTMTVLLELTTVSHVDARKQVQEDHNHCFQGSVRGEWVVRPCCRTDVTSGWVK